MEIKKTYTFKNGKVLIIFDSKYESLMDIPRYAKVYDKYFEMVYYKPMEEPLPVEFSEIDINNYKLKPKDFEVVDAPELKCDCGGTITKTICSSWCSTRQYD